jgi:hypothetical protein
MDLEFESNRKKKWVLKTLISFSGQISSRPFFLFLFSWPISFPVWPNPSSFPRSLGPWWLAAHPPRPGLLFLVLACLGQKPAYRSPAQYPVKHALPSRARLLSRCSRPAVCHLRPRATPSRAAPRDPPPPKLSFLLHTAAANLSRIHPQT